jgi:hypothetical protein
MVSTRNGYGNFQFPLHAKYESGTFIHVLNHSGKEFTDDSKGHFTRRGAKNQQREDQLQQQATEYNPPGKLFVVGAHQIGKANHRDKTKGTDEAFHKKNFW